jgi:2-polyprenyl-3-methyl-5-hydroxy-6-metoxy-1,4-benzoquinol methylase
MDAPSDTQPAQPAIADSYAAAFPTGTTAAERQRLDLQAAMYGRLTTWTLEALGLAPGHHVADVGCGTGALLPRLAERVGPTGRVLGIDRDPQLLEAAPGRARLGGSDTIWYAGRTAEPCPHCSPPCAWAGLPARG